MTAPALYPSTLSRFGKIVSITMTDSNTVKVEPATGAAKFFTVQDYTRLQQWCVAVGIKFVAQTPAFTLVNQGDPMPKGYWDNIPGVNDAETLALRKQLELRQQVEAKEAARKAAHLSDINHH